MFKRGIVKSIAAVACALGVSVATYAEINDDLPVQGGGRTDGYNFLLTVSANGMSFVDEYEDACYPDVGYAEDIVLSMKTVEGDFMGFGDLVKHEGEERVFGWSFGEGGVIPDQFYIEASGLEFDLTGDGNTFKYAFSSDGNQTDKLLINLEDCAYASYRACKPTDYDWYYNLSRLETEEERKLAEYQGYILVGDDSGARTYYVDLANNGTALASVAVYDISESKISEHKSLWTDRNDLVADVIVSAGVYSDDGEYVCDCSIIGAVLYFNMPELLTWSGSNWLVDETKQFYIKFVYIDARNVMYEGTIPFNYGRPNGAKSLYYLLRSDCNLRPAGEEEDTFNPEKPVEEQFTGSDVFDGTLNIDFVGLNRYHMLEMGIKSRIDVMGLASDTYLILNDRNGYTTDSVVSWGHFDANSEDRLIKLSVDKGDYSFIGSEWLDIQYAGSASVSQGGVADVKLTVLPKYSLEVTSKDGTFSASINGIEYTNTSLEKFVLYKDTDYVVRDIVSGAVYQVRATDDNPHIKLVLGEDRYLLSDGIYGGGVPNTSDSSGYTGLISALIVGLLFIAMIVGAVFVALSKDKGKLRIKSYLLACAVLLSTLLSMDVLSVATFADGVLEFDFPLKTYASQIVFEDGLDFEDNGPDRLIASEYVTEKPGTFDALYFVFPIYETDEFYFGDGMSSSDVETIFETVLYPSYYSEYISSKYVSEIKNRGLVMTAPDTEIGWIELLNKEVSPNKFTTRKYRTAPCPDTSLWRDIFGGAQCTISPVWDEENGKYDTWSEGWLRADYSYEGKLMCSMDTTFDSYQRTHTLEEEWNDAVEPLKQWASSNGKSWNIKKNVPFTLVAIPIMPCTKFDPLAQVFSDDTFYFCKPIFESDSADSYDEEVSDWFPMALKAYSSYSGFLRGADNVYHKESRLGSRKKVVSSGYVSYFTFNLDEQIVSRDVQFDISKIVSVTTNGAVDISGFETDIEATIGFAYAPESRVSMDTINAYASANQWTALRNYLKSNGGDYKELTTSGHEADCKITLSNEKEPIIFAVYEIAATSGSTAGKYSFSHPASSGAVYKYSYLTDSNSSTLKDLTKVALIGSSSATFTAKSKKEAVLNQGVVEVSVTNPYTVSVDPVVDYHASDVTVLGVDNYYIKGMGTVGGSYGLAYTRSTLLNPSSLSKFISYPDSTGAVSLSDVAIRSGIKSAANADNMATLDVPVENTPFTQRKVTSSDKLVLKTTGVTSFSVDRSKMYAYSSINYVFNAKDWAGNISSLLSGTHEVSDVKSSSGKSIHIDLLDTNSFNMTSYKTQNNDAVDKMGTLLYNWSQYAGRYMMYEAAVAESSAQMQSMISYWSSQALNTIRDAAKVYNKAKLESVSRADAVVCTKGHTSRGYLKKSDAETVRSQLNEYSAVLSKILGWGLSTTVPAVESYHYEDKHTHEVKIWTGYCSYYYWTRMESCEKIYNENNALYSEWGYSEAEKRRFWWYHDGYTWDKLTSPHWHCWGYCTNYYCDEDGNRHKREADCSCKDYTSGFWDTVFAGEVIPSVYPTVNCPGHYYSEEKRCYKLNCPDAVCAGGIADGVSYYRTGSSSATTWEFKIGTGSTGYAINSLPAGLRTLFKAAQVQSGTTAGKVSTNSIIGTLIAENSEQIKLLAQLEKNRPNAEIHAITEFATDAAGDASFNTAEVEPYYLAYRWADQKPFVSGNKLLNSLLDFEAFSRQVSVDGGTVFSLKEVDGDPYTLLYRASDSVYASNRAKLRYLTSPTGTATTESKSALNFWLKKDKPKSMNTADAISTVDIDGAVPTVTDSNKYVLGTAVTKPTTVTLAHYADLDAMGYAQTAVSIWTSIWRISSTNEAKKFLPTEGWLNLLEGQTSAGANGLVSSTRNAISLLNAPTANKGSVGTSVTGVDSFTIGGSVGSSPVTYEFDYSYEKPPIADNGAGSLSAFISSYTRGKGGETASKVLNMTGTMAWKSSPVSYKLKTKFKYESPTGSTTAPVISSSSSIEDSEMNPEEGGLDTYVGGSGVYTRPTDTNYYTIYPLVKEAYYDTAGNIHEALVVGNVARKLNSYVYWSVGISGLAEPEVVANAVASDAKAKSLASSLGSTAPVCYSGSGITVSYDTAGVGLILQTFNLKNIDADAPYQSGWGYAESGSAHEELLKAMGAGNYVKTAPDGTEAKVIAIPYVAGSDIKINNGSQIKDWILTQPSAKVAILDESNSATQVTTVRLSIEHGDLTGVYVPDEIVCANDTGSSVKAGMYTGNTTAETFDSLRANHGDYLVKVLSGLGITGDAGDTLHQLLITDAGTAVHKDSNGNVATCLNDEGKGWYNEYCYCLGLEVQSSVFTLEPLMFTDRIPIEAGPRTQSERSKYFSSGYPVCASALLLKFGVSSGEVDTGLSDLLGTTWKIGRSSWNTDLIISDVPATSAR